MILAGIGHIGSTPTATRRSKSSQTARQRPAGPKLRPALSGAILTAKPKPGQRHGRVGTDRTDRSNTLVSIRRGCGRLAQYSIAKAHDHRPHVVPHVERAHDA